MKPLELAKKYMDCVFKTGDYEELRNILADNFQFSGPFYNFDTADAYIDSLRTDPPVDFDYEIIKSYSDNLSACLIYKFSKPGVSTTMAQMFNITNGKIRSILLLFDTDTFRSK